MRELIDAVYRFLQFIFPKLICFPTAAESELRFHNGKGIQKKEGCHRDNQSFQLTLKSNTMKNTMQR
jgi:hypothetical protein